MLSANTLYDWCSQPELQYHLPDVSTRHIVYPLEWGIWRHTQVSRSWLNSNIRQKILGNELSHAPDTYSWLQHDDVMKWKHFSRYWSFVRGIHRWPVDSIHRVQWGGGLMFSLMKVFRYAHNFRALCFLLYRQISMNSCGVWSAHIFQDWLSDIEEPNA